MDVPRSFRSQDQYGPHADRLKFERGTDGPRVIMVGLSGSPTATRATAYAGGLARRQRCRLVVAYVVPVAAVTMDISGVAGVASTMATTSDELEAELREEVRQAAEELGVPTTFVTLIGDPFAELRDAADRVKADLVVVGASAQAGHWFVGSIATRLVKLGRWPVLVVP